MELAGVENIDAWSDSRPTELRHRIVLVIDELADLMVTASSKNSIEGAHGGPGQKARAAGIHMLLASQHFKADIITTEITANVPSRLALTTTTHTASGLIAQSPVLLERKVAAIEAQMARQTEIMDRMLQILPTS